MRLCDSWMPSEALWPSGERAILVGVAQVVQGVAALVHAAHQAGRQEIGQHAGGDAHVAQPKRGAERVDGPVHPAVLKS